MHAAVVTAVGIVVDAVILERCIDEDELVQEGKAYKSLFMNSETSRGSLFTPRGSDVVTQQRSSMLSSSSLGQARSSIQSFFSAAVPHSIMSDNVHYECQAMKHPLPQRIFHLFDVLPFGLESPSSVFSVIGRHTNRGLVLGVTAEGLFIVRPYRNGTLLHLQPNGTNRKTVTKSSLISIEKMCNSSTVYNDIKEFREIANRWIDESKNLVTGEKEKEAFRQGQMESSDDKDKEEKVDLLQGMELWALKDLQLPPLLALHDPVPPLRVGSRVLARRFACDRTLHLARVCAVRYDVTYTLRYEADGGIDENVLHNDVHLLDDSEAEQCGVRDKVTVALQKQLPAVIIECLGGEEYRVILTQNPNRALTITRRHIVFISPLLKEALYADPVILEWFRALDPTGSGVVPWKEVRHLILEWETYGQRLSFQKLGEIQRDLCIRVGRMEPQHLRKVPVQEEEMLLRYDEFEYVILRARNLL
ncbi:uncharacterized protein TM35_000281350 [Trypanosoma theileri]|uniref:Uncharacterized protein n=1 Tax=Trypanosoma theileri TaxID=67003 RepID=A0A1X0NQF8_9TRYP|nr:uncharacterized protein TM35_000281350 [Trypanosoma theileri]ORC86419.1 hypothetical protein TM35_000281350 [Trypanosoma theileri]